MSQWETLQNEIIKDFKGVLKLIKKGRVDFPHEKYYPRRPENSQSENLMEEFTKVIEKKDNPFQMKALKNHKPGFEIHFKMGEEIFCVHFAVNRKRCSKVIVNGCN